MLIKDIYIFSFKEKNICIYRIVGSKHIVLHRASSTLSAPTSKRVLDRCNCGMCFDMTTNEGIKMPKNINEEIPRNRILAFGWKILSINTVTISYQDFLYDQQIALSKCYWLLFPEVLFLLF